MGEEPWEWGGLLNEGFDSDGFQNPWHNNADIWPAPLPAGKWQEFGWQTSFRFWTWRDKWRAIWSILRRSKVTFSVKLWLRNDGNVTYLDIPHIRQEADHG